jgi:hypothetical protein
MNLPRSAARRIDWCRSLMGSQLEGMGWASGRGPSALIPLYEEQLTYLDMLAQ